MEFTLDSQTIGSGSEIAILEHSVSTQLAEHLRGNGLRSTRQRIAVLAAIQRMPHCDALKVWNDIRDAMPTLSVQAVHVIVRDLVIAGLLRRIDLPGTSSVRYETRTGDNHHHVLCVVCGRIEDVDCMVGEAPCLKPAQSHGMKILFAEIVFGGMCPECEKDLEQ